jgi:hypothetical protein
MIEKQKLDIFKKSVRGLLKQNKQSLCDGHCVYLSPEGLRCAIGMLITKESYNPKMENDSPSSEIVKNVLKKSGIIVSNIDDVNFLKQLQSIHDSFKPDEWFDLFVKFAGREFGLTEIEAKKLVKSLKPKKGGK